MEQTVEQRCQWRFIHGIVTEFCPRSSRSVAFWQMPWAASLIGRYNRHSFFDK
jgi:hypothetical protein